MGGVTGLGVATHVDLTTVLVLGTRIGINLASDTVCVCGTFERADIYERNISSNLVRVGEGIERATEVA